MKALVKTSAQRHFLERSHHLPLSYGTQGESSDVDFHMYGPRDERGLIESASAIPPFSSESGVVYYTVEYRTSGKRGRG